MKPVARLALVNRTDADLSIVVQYHLLRVARSTLCWRPEPVSMDDLALMRRLYERYLSTSFYDAHRMVAVMEWFSRRILLCMCRLGQRAGSVLRLCRKRCIATIRPCPRLYWPLRGAGH
ncbi:MAG: hypothetical protein EXR05_10810 [Acetobacteraceae bacterium]|nr:hypothetical protein [Acetobacteraceae bacterium]